MIMFHVKQCADGTDQGGNMLSGVIAAALRYMLNGMDYILSVAIAGGKRYADTGARLMLNWLGSRK